MKWWWKIKLKYLIWKMDFYRQNNMWLEMLATGAEITMYEGLIKGKE